jgi:GntR family transcriptional repressor for pyruvate dehydrogenase complex
MRQPRLAEMVASALRDRVVSGDLEDGDMLPGLDHLVKEFGVSPPSVREALRVLENEGLITVRRGNVGGAEVHRPKAESAAYMLGLVLQTKQVPVIDLVTALGHLEPLCARLCAQRKDRRRAVVPALRKAQRDTVKSVNDAVPFEEACQQFHRKLVEGCGNQSLALTVSAFEWLWYEQQQGWAHRVSVLHEYPDLTLRQEGIDEHATLLDAIDEGDGDLAENLAYAHLQHPRIRDLGDAGNATIEAATRWRSGR